MVKSLVDLCTAVCIKNIRDIRDVGGLPYWVIRPVLLKIESPVQLKEVEERSPNLKVDTGECWQRLINRDFPLLVRKHNFEPRNPALWGKVYLKYKELDTKMKKEAAAKLNNGFNALKKEKQAKAVPVMNFNARVHGRIPGQRRAFHGNSFGAPRPKVTSAQSIIQKARREAKEMGRRLKLSTPTGQLAVPQGQIPRAPPGMVEEHKNKSRPFARAIQPPARPVGARYEREQKEREARLLRAKSGVGTKETTMVSDEDLLDQEDVDSDFDSDGETGGLTIDDLEGTLDEEKSSAPASNKPSKGPLMQPQGNGASSAASTSPSKVKPGLSNLSGLAQMKRGLSWKNRPMRLEPIETPPSKPSSKSPTSPSTAAKRNTAFSPPPQPSKAQKQTSAHSPPGTGAVTSTAGSPSAVPKSKPRPMVIGQKRKEPPSVFMKPKNKARRMS
ncbi:RNA polymerase II transcription factor SIII subunit A-domain-containing protein [Hypoxylon sp. FL0543]|nr:RNA polymerase II transcription factor SIII subunit A-domain-containing protein [Hypoxylon sp. FL0543]